MSLFFKYLFRIHGRVALVVQSSVNTVCVQMCLEARGQRPVFFFFPHCCPPYILQILRMCVLRMYACLCTCLCICGARGGLQCVCGGQRATCKLQLSLPCVLLGQNSNNQMAPSQWPFLHLLCFETLLSHGIWSSPVALGWCPVSSRDLPVLVLQPNALPTHTAMVMPVFST